MAPSRTDVCKIPEAFWRAVESQGLAASEVLRQARLPAGLHKDSTAHISIAQFFDIWCAIEMLGDPGIALRMVRDTNTATHKVAFLAAAYARDYRDGLARFARFKLLCSPDNLECEERDGLMSITIRWPSGTAPEPALSVDATFAMLIELGRRGTGQPLVPVEVELARAGPISQDHMAYYGCPVRTNADKNRITLKSADLDRPFISYNPDLLDMLAPAIGQALRDLEGASSLTAQVKAVIKRSMSGGTPGVAAVSRQLGLSDRSLQRHIAAEGKSFRALLNEARQEMAFRLLEDPLADVQEIAVLTGYEDTNSFYRAFNTWTGSTPAKWRKVSQVPARR
ncbi:AraC family transcriptional regulator ligand-binding domain-containing protein [Rhizobium sp. YTU87027]|uniref:AraC family transcriptional regulator n=1 Tax=Rhizobium sp. YTU87027 TaxID=3417741 RepID=UPI003D693E1C